MSFRRRLAGLCEGAGEKAFRSGRSRCTFEKISLRATRLAPTTMLIEMTFFVEIIN